MHLPAVLNSEHVMMEVAFKVLPRWRQVADTGNISTPSGTFQVTDTKASPALCLVTCAYGKRKCTSSSVCMLRW